MSREDSTLLKPASGACPGRDSNPHEGNPHRILSPQRANPNHLKPLYLSISYLLPILAGVGWNGVVLCWRGYKMVTLTATSHQTSVFLAGSSIGITSPVCRLYIQVTVFRPTRTLSCELQQIAALYRAIEKYGPTLLIDEADTFLRENRELLGILNAGYERGKFAVRAVPAGDDYDVRLCQGATASL